MSNFLTDYWPKKWPTKKQWQKLPEVLSKKEKNIFLSLFFVMIISFIYSSVAFYQSKTEVVPAHGGIYREGFIQSTRWLTINPIYASQSEIERDIIEVVFDGLMAYNNNRDLIPNIAIGYTTEDNKTFNVTLRSDVYWSDGEKLTAEDVLFTVKTIQSPDYQSTLRQQWAGVRVEKVSDYEVRFTLENSSSVFVENLTLKPIPHHIFVDYSPRDFRYSIYNMKPVSSGPYRFKQVKEDITGDVEFLKLDRNPYYFKSRPYLDEISFHFFRDVEELLRAQRRGEIDGFTLPDSLRVEIDLEEIRGFNHHQAILPRYFSVFFNLQGGNGATKVADVRRALNYATDKEELVEKVLNGRGYIVSSPLLPEFYNKEEVKIESIYDLVKAKELLESSGFEDGKKSPEEPFSFTEELKKDSQGEEVRNLQRCFLYLSEEDADFYQGEVTGFYDEITIEAVNYFQEKHRAEILDPHNFKSGTGMVAGSTQEKLNDLCGDLFNETISLEISITTLEDPMLSETAKLLKEQWEKLGIRTVIKEKSALELREDSIRQRDFETLLFGTMLTGVLNPLPLWHSTKTEDPGINLSGYQSTEADELLEIIIAKEGEEREEALLKFEEKILEETPIIFLYNPYFIYSIAEKVKGVEEKTLVNSSKRFEDIDKWYINTKRVFKK